jgi:hypothetical protein
MLYSSNTTCKRNFKNDLMNFHIAFVRLVDIVNATGKGYAVWQEIIDHHVKVKADTVVEVWKVRVLNNFSVLS